jgi:hypothetical protein
MVQCPFRLLRPNLLFYVLTSMYTHLSTVILPTFAIPTTSDLSPIAVLTNRNEENVPNLPFGRTSIGDCQGSLLSARNGVVIAYIG